MTNDEVYQRACDKVKLRWLSLHKEDEHFGKLTIFYNNPIEDMENCKFVDFCFANWILGNPPAQ